MARGQVVRGTPVNILRNNEHQGVSPRIPHGMKGTQPEEYTSDERGYQAGRENGTPYRSQAGNGPEARRLVERSTSAVSSDHGDQNSYRTNGRGVVLDGANDPEKGYEPPHERTMDSPVPEHAPWFDPSFIHGEDAAHLGSGIGHLAEDNNDLREFDGVMSRGIRGTSMPHGPEDELLLDDDKPSSSGAEEHRAEEHE